MFIYFDVERILTIFSNCEGRRFVVTRVYMMEKKKKGKEETANAFLKTT